jgi:hypothetical protein
MPTPGAAGTDSSDPLDWRSWSCASCSSRERGTGPSAKFKPFNRLVEPDTGIRDEVTDIVARAVARAQPAWLLVNNKAEGSAPLTIRALAERIAADTGNTPGRVE